MVKENVIADKSYNFALSIVKTYLFLSNEKHEFVLSKQLLRSGTAIGALVSESRFAQSKADFIHKLHIAVKEANETMYWISLLRDSDFITTSMYDSLFPDIDEIICILSAIIKTSKSRS